MQPQPHIVARGQDRVHVRGKAGQQPGELSGGLWRVQLVEIINNQRDAAVSVGELRQHPVDHRRCVEVGCRCWQFRAAVCTGGVTDRAEQGQPELLGVVLAALHLHEGEPARLTRSARPGAQQRRLPAAGRSRDDRHLPAPPRDPGQREDHPGRSAGELLEPPSQTCPDIYAWHPGAGHAVLAPSVSVPGQRTYCQRRANPGSAALSSTRRRRDPIQPRESPGSGDGLSPDWRRAWACCEGWHGRQGTCPEIPGRYRDFTSYRRRRRRGPARLRADPPVRARPGPQRSEVLRRAGGAEPVLGHRRRLPVGVPDHPRRSSRVRRAPDHRPQPAPGGGRDRRRQRRDQHGDPPGLLPPPRRPRRRGLAVRRGRGPHRARGDQAPAGAGQRPGPAGAGGDLRRPLHPRGRRRARRAGLARPQPLAGQHLHPLPRPRHPDVHRRRQRRVGAHLQPQPVRGRPRVHGRPGHRAVLPVDPLHLRAPRPARHPRRRRGAPAVHRRHRSQRQGGAGRGRPDPLLHGAGENAWAGVKANLDAVTERAAAPIIAKYTGVLAAADIEVFTYTTTFQIMQSLRLDRGLGVSRPVNP